MLNKFYKIIHKKYSTFFSFIFFLRYLFAIFIVFIALFLVIPSFFNYEDKAKIIKKFILNDYGFKIEEYEKIKFQALPLPKLVINEAVISLGKTPVIFKVKKFKIYPKIINIYNFKNYDAKKIILIDSYVSIEASDLNHFTKKIIKQKKKLFLKNSDIKITNKKKVIMSLDNVRFNNFSHNENQIYGNVFGKKFKMDINKNFKNLNFKLQKAGINVSINFDTNQNLNIKRGIFKSKILNTNIKFNFDYDGKILKINNSFFRNKNLSFNNDSLIFFKPYVDIYSKLVVEDFNFKLFEKVDLDKVLANKVFIKKINSKNEIYFKSKKFSQNLINELDLKIDLAYGRISYTKKIVAEENIFKCKGDINLLEEMPSLLFNCSINSEDKKKLLKIFSIKSKKKGKPLKVIAQGNINIKRKEVNFEKISIDDFLTSKEDLKYFKSIFESNFLDKNIVDNFSLKKIKNFILEIS